MAGMIQVKGLGTLTRRIKGMVEDVSGSHLGQITMRGAEPIAATAKQLAPVRTGELRGSIHPKVVNLGRGRAEVAIEATAKHAIFVEFGTSRMRAQPYMRPALTKSHHQSVVILSGDFKAVVAKNSGG